MRRVVIGIGNPARGDDAAGREVARRLWALARDDFEILESDGEATDLLALMEGAEAAILVDACVSGAAPGTIRRFDAADGPLPAARYGLSTHGLGLADAIEFGRALGRLPPVCIVYAIEGTIFETGAAMSVALTAAIDELVPTLLKELEAVPL